ncbi:MAG: mechanosensitive ion channel [Bdellovibrionales bacterium]|nr:mechanosensitive ion channel [Bdellovibrionales bacterium]
MEDKSYLLEEIDRSLAWFSWYGLAALFWIIAVGFAVFFTVQALLRHLERTGWSRRLHVPTLRVVFNLIFPLFFVINATFFMARRSVLFELAGLVALVAMLIVLLVEFSRGLMPAVAMLVTAGLGEGDWIQIGGSKGRLQRVGLFRCQLQNSEGESYFVPTRTISRLGIKKLAKGMIHPLDFHVSLGDRSPSPDFVMRLEKHLYFSPYRAKTGKIRVSMDENKNVLISMELLSQLHSDQAEAYARKMLDASLQEDLRV